VQSSWVYTNSDVDCYELFQSSIPHAHFCTLNASAHPLLITSTCDCDWISDQIPSLL